MNKRNFVRLLSQATACTIVAPYVPDILTSNTALPPKIDLDLRSSPYYTRRITGWVKISEEMMSDLPALTAMLQQKGLELSVNAPDWEGRTEIEIAEDGDDFIHSIKKIFKKYLQYEYKAVFLHKI